MRSLLMLVALVSALPQTPREVALSKHMEQELDRRWKVVLTPVEAGVLVQRLALPARLEGAPIVKTVDSDTPLANVLPGGVLFFSTGLLRVGTETEVEAIVAHLMAHLAAGHGRPRPSSHASIPIAWMGSETGICSRFSESALLVPSSVRPVIQKNENEADILALEYLKNSGYVPLDPTQAFARLRLEHPPLRKGVPSLRSSDR